MGDLIVLCLPDAIVLCAAYSIVISVKFYKSLYNKIYLKKYNSGYSPYVSVFIPCKGRDEHFERNIRHFLEARYRNAKVFFIVESMEDDAYPLIRKQIEQVPNTYLVVAGLSKYCGQKNYNLLQGIKASEERDDVYVFLDAHTTVNAEQLQDLLLPLSSSKVTAAVGFRWNILQKNTLGEKLHAFMVALQWGAMNCFWVQSIWGGATAIRREDFEKMGVREYWSKTVVDDMTLQQMIQQQRRKAVFVPSCVTETDYTIKDVKSAVLWFKRQILYVKFYLRPLWLGMLALFLYVGIHIIGLPLLLAYTAIYPSKKLILFSGMKGVFALLTMLFVRLLKRPADDNSSALSWFILSPIYLLLSAWAGFLGIFTKVFGWKEITYRLDYRGTVKEIQRGSDYAV
ncbi:MAG: glycosyltransferase family 2 protein [bacterium]|nr:glycosyltransferase family 2 protein [bacterium]